MSLSEALYDKVRSGNNLRLCRVSASPRRLRWSLPAFWDLRNQGMCWDRLGHRAEQKHASALTLRDSRRMDAKQADI